MSQNLQSLYFFAIVPPSPIREEVQGLKEYFWDVYHSKHALNSPPHITLLSPFKRPEHNENELARELEIFTAHFQPFHAELRNFAAFPPRVIFIDVEMSEKLLHLQKKAEILARNHPRLFNYNYDSRPYHPHLTLAFKDLSNVHFRKAWEEFKDKEYRADFRVEKLSLLKYNGHIWEVIQESVLSS